MTNPTTEAGWLHKLDMAKSEAWRQGYQQAERRYLVKIQELESRISDLGWHVDALNERAWYADRGWK